MNKKENRRTVGLALGSGGFRGYAHIGVIKAFEKHGIPIDFLSGASSGALVAAPYAIHRDINKLEEQLMEKTRENWMMVVDPSRSSGLIAGSKFSNFLRTVIGHHSFTDTKIPLRIIATDLLSGRARVFSQGDIARAVRASTSVPLVFKPEAHEGQMLADGGLSDPVPVALLADMGADIKVAVNLYSKKEFSGKRLSLTQIAVRSMRIFLYNLAAEKVKAADVLIEVDVSRYQKDGLFSKYFSRSMTEGIMALGERAAEKAIPQIKRLLEEKKNN